MNFTHDTFFKKVNNSYYELVIVFSSSVLEIVLISMINLTNILFVSNILSYNSLYLIMS